MNPKPGTSREGPAHPTRIAVVGAGAVPSLVTDAGESRLVAGATGWICRAGDVDDLVRAMRTAIADKVSLPVHGARAWDRIVSEFSVERLVRTTAERFDDLLAGSQ